MHALNKKHIDCFSPSSSTIFFGLPPYALLCSAVCVCVCVNASDISFLENLSFLFFLFGADNHHVMRHPICMILDKNYTIAYNWRDHNVDIVTKTKDRKRPQRIFGVEKISCLWSNK